MAFSLGCFARRGRGLRPGACRGEGAGFPRVEGGRGDPRGKGGAVWESGLWCPLSPWCSSWSVWLWNGSKFARWPGQDGGRESLLTRVYFCSECFWVLSRAWVREEAATGHQAFGWGLWRSSESCLAGLSRQDCFLPHLVWAPGRGAVRGCGERCGLGFVSEKRRPLVPSGI